MNRIICRYGRLFFLALLLSCGVFSCRKFVDIEPSGPILTGSKVFSSDASAEAAVLGMYSHMMSPHLSITNGGATLYAGLTADELSLTGTDAELQAFATNSITPVSNVGLSRLWTQNYINIYHANAILEGLGRSPALTPQLSSRLKGEALLVRALHHFYLASFFGDIPVVSSTDPVVNSSLSRTPVAEVYQQVIADLREARSLLPEAYYTAGRNRPNRWTAAALLARVYLYTQNWQSADEEASAVIASGLYHLEPLSKVFLAASNEAIWQLSPVTSGINTAEGNTFIPASAATKPAYVIAPSLLQAFDAGDKRKQEWLRANTIGGQNFYYPFKYKVRTGGTPYAEHNMVLRLAELYLIRAEARAHSNNFPGARSDLDLVRTRAGLPSVNAASQTSLLAAIEQERRVELFAEWGHRWFDLIRTQRADAVLGAVKSPWWQPHDKLYPILHEDILRNPLLTQNPGY
ncbi:MAG TPA: RagB/SusD family nutrient uptake outer membrane protein [Flavisolibacter sp.]|jgi:hypothetical protein